MRVAVWVLPRVTSSDMPTTDLVMHAFKQWIEKYKCSPHFVCEFRVYIIYTPQLLPRYAQLSTLRSMRIMLLVYCAIKTRNCSHNWWLYNFELVAISWGGMYTYVQVNVRWQEGGGRRERRRWDRREAGETEPGETEEGKRYGHL